MKLELCKQLIESKSIPDGLIIFESKESNLIPLQYIEEIARFKDKDLIRIDNIEGFVKMTRSAFSTIPSSQLSFITLNEFEYQDECLKGIKNLYIICSSISAEARDTYSEFIVTIPKLEKWMYVDYVKSFAPGLKQEQVEWLVDNCGDSIDRLVNEVRKISIFEQQFQASMFNEFKQNGLFSDLSSKTIFDMSNAILKRDTKALCEVYKVLDSIDVEPMGLFVVLYNNIRNIIQIQLDKYSNAQKLDMSDKQFYVLKNYNCGFYTRDELLIMFNSITSLDRKIKTGMFPMEHLIDYLIIKTIGVA